MRLTPRPIASACLTAPFDPSVSCSGGSSPRSARKRSVAARVPEPASRRSQVAPSRSVDGLPSDDDQLVVEERRAVELVARRPPADAEVGTVRGQALEHRRTVPDLEQDLGAGMFAPVRLDQRGQQVLAGGVHGDHADAGLAHAVGLDRRLPSLVEQAEHLRRVRLEGGAGFGQAHPPTLALDELDAELARERAERRGHRGLAHVQLLGCGLDASRARDCKERPKLRDGQHPRSLSDAAGQ